MAQRAEAAAEGFRAEGFRAQGFRVRRNVLNGGEAATVSQPLAQRADATWRTAVSKLQEFCSPWRKAQGAEAAAGGFRAQRRVRNVPFGAEAATVSQPLLQGAEAAAEGFSAGRNVLNGFETLYRQEV